MIKEMLMALVKNMTILLLIGLSTLFVLATSLPGQDAKAEEQESQASEETIPAAPDEIVEPNPAQVDPRAILAAAIDKLGGDEAFDKLKDITFDLEHKNYFKGKNLYFIELARGYYKPGKFFEGRLDFSTYTKPNDLGGAFFDYREVLGEDGPFKYLEGKPLRGPIAVREAGERLTRTYFELFGPFCLDRNQDNIKYLGKVSWKTKVDDLEVERTCHKILIGHTQNRMGIRGSVISFYIDTTTNEIRRYVYEPLMKGSKTVQRTRIVDILETVQAADVRIPSFYFITDYWSDRLNATHKMRVTGVEANTGLEGIGFKMTNQGMQPKQGS
jgi:hypothetical protein